MAYFPFLTEKESRFGDQYADCVRARVERDIMSVFQFLTSHSVFASRGISTIALQVSQMPVHNVADSLNLGC